MADKTSYWWNDDSEKVVSILKERRTRWIWHLQETGILSRIKRSYEFFHNIYYSYYDSGAVIPGGQEGELNLISLNEYRSVIALLKTYVTGSRPELDTISHDSTNKGLEAAKLGNSILDAMLADQTSGFEAALDQAVEDALVLSAGYLWNPWDDSSGEQVMANVETDELVYEGDVKFYNPHILDVVHDVSVRKFEESNWVLVRNRENKYDLAAQYPEYKEQIEASGGDQDLYYEFFYRNQHGRLLPNEDYIYCWYAYHKPTPAVPDGRYIKFINDVTLEDSELEEQHIPVHRLVPADFMLTGLGYTPAFDLQGPQEALNSVASTLLTNQDTLGAQKVWFRAGETINRATLDTGITVVQTETPPQPLGLLGPQAELLSAIELYSAYIEKLSGVNAVSRGQPEAPSASGAALALIESRTMQAASDLVTNFARFISKVGTSVLKIFEFMAEVDKIISVVGEGGQRHMITFTGEDLVPISRVSVVPGNPALRTLSGRVGLAQALLQSGLLQDPQQFLTVVKTGNLENLTQATDSQIRVAQAENDAMLKGEKVFEPLIIDDHVTHILRHASILDTPVTRRDPEIAPEVLAHITLHVQHLSNPDTQRLMMLLGYRLDPTAMQQPMAMGPGAPPAGGEVPEGEATPEDINLEGVPGGMPEAVEGQVRDTATGATQ